MLRTSYFWEIKIYQVPRSNLSPTGKCWRRDKSQYEQGPATQENKSTSAVYNTTKVLYTRIVAGSTENARNTFTSADSFAEIQTHPQEQDTGSDGPRSLPSSRRVGRVARFRRNVITGPNYLFRNKPPHVAGNSMYFEIPWIFNRIDSSDYY